ncbi:MAG TPA: hypothetical protein VMT02_03215 [Burkholderiales bacterium]|nr:hypothetical protein [Burkholderiales bacterium]
MRAALVAALAMLPAVALAQSYRCVGADGKKYYGQAVPPQCVGQPVEQLDSRGVVVKRIDAVRSAEDRAKQEAEEAERKKQAAAAKEQSRKDNALLSSYTSEQDIEIARSRALEGSQRAAKDLEQSIAALKKRRGAPSADTRAIDADLKTQEAALAARQKDMTAINARYDEDKKRYIEITKRGK